MSRSIVSKRDNPFVQIDKTCLQDDRLSWKAKGLFAYLMSLPSDWKIYTTEVRKHAVDGKDSLHGAMKELERFGYLAKTAQRISGKWHGYDYFLHERPEDAVNHLKSSKLTEAGKPEPVKPLPENPPLLISYLTNNDLTNKREDYHRNDKPTAKTTTDFTEKEPEKKWQGKEYEDLYLKFLTLANLSPAVYPWSKNRKIIKQIMKTTSLEDFKTALNGALKDEWLLSNTAGDLACIAKKIPSYLSRRVPTEAEFQMYFRRFDNKEKADPDVIKMVERYLDKNKKNNA